MPEDQLWQYPRLRIELENYFFGNISHQPLVVAPKKMSPREFEAAATVSQK